jgi:hypothetical protein
MINTKKTQRIFNTLSSTCTYRRQVRIKGECNETLQKILDKVNKNYYIMSIGDMNAREENDKIN